MAATEPAQQKTPGRSKPVQERRSIVVRFCGDSGDGMQLAGSQLTMTSALAGNDIATFPDYPAEIRAPRGTLAGVSGFQGQFAADEVIVASKHVSETGNPSLTAHVPGDSEKRELGIAAPSTLGAALAELFAARDEFGLSYDVSFEATHHGPTGLDVPVTFVEIGSATSEWRDPKAGEAVARAIMKAARSRIS